MSTATAWGSFPPALQPHPMAPALPLLLRPSLTHSSAPAPLCFPPAGAWLHTPEHPCHCSVLKLSLSPGSETPHHHKPTPVPARSLHAQTLPAAPSSIPSSLLCLPGTFPQHTQPLLPLCWSNPLLSTGCSHPWGCRGLLHGIQQTHLAKQGLEWILAGTLLFPGPKARSSPSHSREKGQHWSCAQRTGTALTAQGPCGVGIGHRLPSSETQHPTRACCVRGVRRVLTLQHQHQT